MEVCQFMAELQMSLRVPGALSPEVTRLHSRPFQFIDTLKIGQAIKEHIEDEHLKRLPEFGGADQFLSGYVLAVPDWSSDLCCACGGNFQLTEWMSVRCSKVWLPSRSWDYPVEDRNGVDSGPAAFEPTGVDSRHSAAAVLPEKDGEAGKLRGFIYGPAAA